jgi:glycosyltransferase involved in cell wall biosynthesis
MFCSTVIPTVARPTLARAVCSVLDQSFAAEDFEVIVVNDSGAALPEADWQHSPRVRLIHTHRRERSVARNTGAAIAKGKYLHFLDDDDWITPGAFEALWRLSQEAGDAAWLYGSYRTVDNEGHLVEEFHPNITGNILALLVSGEGIPLQASLLRADRFFVAGTFDPNMPASQDRDLGRRLVLTDTAAYTPTVVAVIRVGEQGSTTKWAILKEMDHLGREKALSAQGAFTRLRASATSSRQRGRVSRAYFASTAWNWRRKRWLTAASRASMGMAFAGWHIFSPHYWRGITTRVTDENRD